jgi:hypothetical protein
MQLALLVMSYSIQFQRKAMNSSKTFCFFLAVFLTMPIAGGGKLYAGNLSDDHPAVAIALDYVNYVSRSRYEVAALQIKPDYLEDQVRKYVRAVRSTASIETEEAMLRRMGVERIRDIEEMGGMQFYVAYQQALDRERKLTPATRARMEESFRSELLGGVSESQTVAHAVIRTRRETLNAVISELLVVSLELIDGKWLIAPEYQELSMKPLITGEVPREIEVGPSN